MINISVWNRKMRGERSRLFSLTMKQQHADLLVKATFMDVSESCVTHCKVGVHSSVSHSDLLVSIKVFRIVAKPWTANLAKKVTAKSEEWALFIQQLTPIESSVEEEELLWEQLPSVHINHQSRSETKWNICSIARTHVLHSDMVLQRNPGWF